LAFINAKETPHNRQGQIQTINILTILMSTH